MNFWIYIHVIAIILENGSTQIINLQYWMANLPVQLKDVPLIYLAIPGSHNSMTYGITKASGLGPDAHGTVKTLYPVFAGAIRRWSITQAVNVRRQLDLGIRYLDLRVATKTNTTDFFFTHGLYAEKIYSPLMQVRDFVDTHPGEVVILDFQHFYGFGYEHHQRLTQVIVDIFGNRLVAKNKNLESLTLNTLNYLKQQILVVFRSIPPTYAWSWFLEPQFMPTPWPEQTTTQGLISYLQSVKRQPGRGCVHQAVLTPTASFITLRFFSSLREQCAVPVKNKVIPILRKFSPGSPVSSERMGERAPAPVNVVIADYVDMDDAIFPRTIIELNMKLLLNSTSNVSSADRFFYRK